LSGIFHGFRLQDVNVSTVSHDFRYAIRLLLKHPGFTAVVVVSLALGIGANAMMFSLINAIMLRTLPYPDPDRLVILWFTPPKQPNGRVPAAPGNCFDLLENNTVFEDIGCFRFAQGVFSEDETGAAGPENLRGEAFSYGVQQAIGVAPIVGRWFTAEDDKEGRERVVIISHSLWLRRFGGSADVIGRKVRVADVRSSELLSTIVGVMPAGFTFTDSRSDYWVPLRLPASARNSPARAPIPVARLKPGMSILQAQAAMDAKAVTFAEKLPSVNKGWGIRVERFGEAFINAARVRQPLIILQSVVGLVLLIACANVAGLLLAQGAAQQKELTVRAALGSTRWRIVRQLLCQSVVLSLLGGLLSLGVAWAGLRVLVNSLPAIPGLPGLKEANIDPVVSGFVLVISITAGFLFGILPALSASRPNVMGTLKESSRGSTLGPSRQRLRGIFVVAQISIALTLLIGAGLMINSFLRLYTVDVGLDPKNIMTFQIRFGGEQFYKYTGKASASGAVEIGLSERINLISEQIRTRLSTVGGVKSATAIGVTPPLSGGAYTFSFGVEGRQPPPAESEGLRAQYFPVMPDYFTTLGIPVLRGRPFTVQDSAAGTPVVLISSTMSKRFFSNEDPIGKRIQLDFINDPPRQIIGIVGDIRQNSRNENVQPQMYVPYAQVPLVVNGAGWERMFFMVRYSGSAAQLGSNLRFAVADVDRAQAQAVVEFKPLEEYLSDQLQGFRQYVILLGVFAGIAFTLAVVGIYGMMAHSVNQRAGEIGIRIALGATPSTILRFVLRRGIILIASGLVIGFGLSLALTRVIQNSLWGVTPTDGLTFMVVITVLSIIGLIACYIPARRALRVDPVGALRSE
jgi:putative ABC transport system permease protein